MCQAFLYFVEMVGYPERNIMMYVYNVRPLYKPNLWAVLF